MYDTVNCLIYNYKVFKYYLYSLHIPVLPFINIIIMI